MSVRQYEEERQQREQFLKKENEILNKHKGELIDKVWGLETENKRLREALEFYADEKTYEADVINQWEPITPINKDNGEIARQALGGETN